MGKGLTFDPCRQLDRAKSRIGKSIHEMTLSSSPIAMGPSAILWPMEPGSGWLCEWASGVVFVQSLYMNLPSECVS